MSIPPSSMQCDERKIYELCEEANYKGMEVLDYFILENDHPLSDFFNLKKVIVTRSKMRTSIKLKSHEGVKVTFGT